MKHIFVFCLLVLPTNLMPQSPVNAAYAYSRNTISGIPSQNPFPPSYFIYVVIQRGTVISVSGVCLQGKRHEATLQRVDSPVLTDHDVGVPTGKKDTLVKRTSDDVYQVNLGERTGPCGNDRTEDKLAQRYAVVVCLKSGGSSWYGLVPRLVPLAPAAAM